MSAFPSIPSGEIASICAMKVSAVYHRFLPNFTSYLSPEVYAHFYDGFPKNADVVGAVRYAVYKLVDACSINSKLIAKNSSNSEQFDDCSTSRYIKSSPFNINDEIPLARAVIARLHPHHEEILAVMGLMFWSIGEHKKQQCFR